MQFKQCDDLTRGPNEISLFKAIDLDKTHDYNSSVQDSCRVVFKPRCDKQDTTKYCETTSEDSELLITVTFVGEVRMKNFVIIGGENGMAPSKCKMFVNNHNLDFTTVGDIPPTQEFELPYDPHGDLEIPTKYSKFQNVHTLALYFPSNFGNDKTRIYYIQFNGENLNVRHGIVIASYELKPNVSENKNINDVSGLNNNNIS